LDVIVVAKLLFLEAEAAEQVLIEDINETRTTTTASGAISDSLSEDIVGTE
jgi:hypothetical protein